MTGVHHGTGQHASVIPPNELPQGLKVCLTSLDFDLASAGHMS
jgi:hypothetical protein